MSLKSRSSESRPKVVVIGIDGATFDLIKPWAEQGRLPVLKNLIAEGVHGHLKSSIPPLSCPAWKCFSTGKNPGKLGVFSFRVLKPDSYTQHLINASHFNSDEIWDLLGREGIESGVFNLPVTYPPKKINGFMVCGILTPGMRSEFTFPPELKQELIEKTDFEILPKNPRGTYSISDDFVKDHHSFLDTHVRAMKYLIGEKKWDFLILVFRETDTIQHAMWEYMDADHSTCTEEMRSRYGNVIRQYWEKLDAKMGEIIGQLPKDTSLMIMSDHGFGRLEKRFNINDWLIREGFLVLGNRRGVSAALLPKMRVSREGVRNWVERLYLGYVIRRLLPRDYIRKIARKIPKAEGALELENANVIWKRSRAFVMGGEQHAGMIYLNKKGRPNGFIEVDGEYEQLRDEIIEKLSQVTEPETGHKLEMDIYKPEEIYWGERMENSPDIIALCPGVGFDPTVGHSSLFSPGRKGYSASHRMDGVFIAKGPEIKEGVEIRNAEIVDLAPTLLHLMGVSIPKDMDGRVLREIFREGSCLEREIKYQEAREVSIEEVQLSPEDEMMIQDRLRGLG